MRERTRRETKGGLSGDHFKNRLTISSWYTVRSRSCDLASDLLDWNIFGRELSYAGWDPGYSTYSIAALRSEQPRCRQPLISSHHCIHRLAFNNLVALGQKMGGEASARLSMKDAE